MNTLPPSKLTVTSLPFNVVTSPAVRSVESTSPETTWYNKMSARAPVGSNSRSSTTVPSAANAASVGANSVKGPAAVKSSANSAATTAASRTV